MKVLILFGSETGNAEELAFSLKMELQTNRFECSAVNIENYDHSLLPSEKYVVFIASTTGDGEFPSTMKSFWSLLLRKSLPPTCLATMNFAVFGLGDSSYDKFNYVARKLHARLTQLGGKELVGLGLGDDQGKYGLFTAYDGWLKALLTSLNKNAVSLYPPLTTNDMLSVEDIEVSLNGRIDDYSISVVSDAHETAAVSVINSITKGTILSTKVVQNTRLTAANWNQDVRLVEFQMDALSDSTTLLYQPGNTYYLHFEF